MKGLPNAKPVNPAVKLRFFIELPDVIVKLPEPEVTVTFTAVALLDPAVFPTLTVALKLLTRVNPPVPDVVKFVAVAMDTITVLDVMLVRAMFPDPNAIERVLVLDELNTVAVALNPLRAKVPAVKVISFVMVRASASV
jgi:hypothetical protein